MALTDTAPSLADAVIGPNVSSVGLSTHIHTGRPTSPTRLGPGSGTMPILIATILAFFVHKPLGLEPATVARCHEEIRQPLDWNFPLERP